MVIRAKFMITHNSPMNDDKPFNPAHINILASQGYKGLREFAATLTQRVRELDAKERNCEMGTGESTEILGSIIESYVYAVVQANVKYEVALLIESKQL